MRSFVLHKNWFLTSRCCVAADGNGMVARRSVPSRLDLISRKPPSSFSRSRMPASPTSVFPFSRSDPHVPPRCRDESCLGNLTLTPLERHCYDELFPALLLQSPRRLARPRTSPFHGGNTGSNPVGDANKIKGFRRITAFPHDQLIHLPRYLRVAAHAQTNPPILKADQ